MNTSKKLISNTIYLFTDWFIITFMGFLFWFIAGKTLIPEEYGIVSTTTNLTLILSGLSLLGLNASLWKLIPEYQAKKQRKKIFSLIKFVIKTTLISNLLIIFFLLILSQILQQIIKIPITAIWLASITTFALSFSTQFGTIIYAFQDMRKYLETDLFGQITKILVSIILIFLGFRHFGSIIGFLVGYVVLALLRLSRINLSGSTEKIEGKKILFEYALPAFIANLAWTFFLNGQYVLLTTLTSTKETGIFTIAMTCSSLIFAVPNILNSALLPIISKLSVNPNSKKQQARFIDLVLRYSAFLCFPMIFFLIIFSVPMILIFSRPEYLQASKLFPILSLTSTIYGLGSIFLNNLYAIGKTKLHRNIVILTTVIFFILAPPLIKLFSSFGLALAYSFSVTFLTTLSFFYLGKILKIKIQFKNLGKIFLASLVSFVFLYITTKFISYIFFEFLLVVIAGVIYLIVLIPLKFYSREDIIILNFLARKIPFFKKQILSIVKFFCKLYRF